MITADYKFNDKPFREFLVAMKEFGRDSIAVGLVGALAGATHAGTTLQVWEVGALQEFGSEDGHIPERSFIRSTLANTSWVRDVLASSVRRVVQGKSTARQALNRAGRILADGIRTTVLNVVPPPNAQATVDWKGHGHTLIGLTDALYDAISHKIIPSGR